MSALKFYPLKVKDVRQETADCVSVSMEIPEELADVFRFTAGQYLTFRTQMNGTEVRRSYSICVSPKQCELRVAVKKMEEGKFSTFANETLKPGDVIEVMPPLGKFSPKLQPAKNKQYLFIAAGSGITPVMSIMTHVLEEEQDAHVTLVYGNRNRNTIIFREPIEALKNKYMQRFSLYHIMSREQMDMPLFSGRITAQKCLDLFDTLIDVKSIDEVFICGPEDMIISVRKQLLDLGMKQEQVHIELFTSPDQPKAAHEKWVQEHAADSKSESEVTITLDGATFKMKLAYAGDSVLDAALKHGADLPYACKGGVCCTCRAKLVKGEVDMEVNYSLGKDELEKGFILTCQAHPKTDKVVIDFDAR
jgi:ring-1,2-phenylacetyl-CoA epoxidase subunit PaaE